MALWTSERSGGACTTTLRGEMTAGCAALLKERNETIAIKTLRNLDGEGLLRFKNEFRSAQSLQHRRRGFPGIHGALQIHRVAFEVARAVGSQDENDVGAFLGRPPGLRKQVKDGGVRFDRVPSRRLHLTQHRNALAA